MSVRFGVSPIAWINDDMPELGGDTPLETVLGDARDIGFAGIELGGTFPRDPDPLRDLLTRFDLDLIGGWYSAKLLERTAEEELEALLPHLALLKAMGSRVFIQAETSNAIHGQRDQALAATPRLGNQDWAEFGRRLTVVADYVSGQGMRFAYHHHLGTVVERQQDIENFLAFTGPSAGLTVDTGHAALGGIDPVWLIERAPGRVAHVHCKDIRPAIFGALEARGGAFLEGVMDGMFTVPGDGALDYAAVMQALARIDYSGWIVVEAEQDPAKADPRSFGEIGLATLRREAAAAGLEEMR
jgi:inosose dehydratase